jgi:short-subunit dehydrogenase
MSNGGGGRVRAALVTGASSGIGLELCRLLVLDGARVVMVARDEERLERAARWVQGEVKGAAVNVVALDLARPDAAAALHARVERDIGEIDFLANDAGFGISGPLEKADPSALHALLQVNVTTLVDLTRLFLPAMLERRRGRILQVASTASFLPGPGMSVYYASKAFVLSFGQALAHEVRGRGVTVTTLCPGPTPTGFQERAGVGGTKLWRSVLRVEAHPVAEAGYRGALEGRALVIPGMANKLMVAGLRLVPRAAMAAMVARVHEPAEPEIRRPGPPAS